MLGLNTASKQARLQGTQQLVRKTSVNSVEAAIVFSMLQHGDKLRAVRAPPMRCGVVWCVVWCGVVCVVREDFTQVLLEWSLGDFLNSRWTKRERALPFRRNVMDKVQTDHGVFKN